MEHRLGGLEKDALTGNISSEPLNHQIMCETRAAKVAGIAKDFPPSKVEGPAKGRPAGDRLGQHLRLDRPGLAKGQCRGQIVAFVHLRHLNPLPSDLGEIIGRYKKVLVPETNLGQLSRLLRERYLSDVIQLNKIQGKPLKSPKYTTASWNCAEETMMTDMTVATPIQALTKKDFESGWMCVGARAAATTPSSPRSPSSCPSWAFRAKTSRLFRHRLFQPFSVLRQTYGLHTIHGRALAIATGLKVTRPEVVGMGGHGRRRCAGHRR